MAEEKEPKAEQGSVLEKEGQEEAVEKPDYTPEEKDYLKQLQKRIADAKTLRSGEFIEFDGLGLSQYYHANEEVANTEIKSKKNKVDTVYQSGTVRTKMMAFLAAFQGFNFRPDISAFDKDDIPINALGNAMEDIIDKTEELELDEEKRMLREYELLKQGTVFLEELWQEKWEVDKKLTKGFTGKISGTKWSSKKKKCKGAPKREILPILSVYLGDLRKYMIEDQPYIFAIAVKGRSETESIYGSWERWRHVPKDRQQSADLEATEQEDASRLSGVAGKDQVEVIIYQDKPNNELQILLNGVMMLPMGYPLTSVSPDGEYTIVQQNLEPIRHNFAYGKSFVFRNKNLVAILDEMMKMLLLKTQKSVFPPYLNLSGRVISKTIFMPGNIARGITADSIVPVSAQEVKGVQAGEFNMVQEIIKNVDANTASQTFSGAREAGGKTTATQIIELQRQARVMMGLMILAVTLLEKKLTTKRLMIILKNWFEPVDQEVDEARKVLKNRYQMVSRSRSIEGEGQGIRITLPTEHLPTTEQIMQTEDKMKSQYGMPVRIVAIDPEQLKEAKRTWVVTITPKERKTSETSKLLFQAMVASAADLGLQMDPSILAQRFSETWEENPKLFSAPQAQPQQPQQPQQSQSRQPAVKLPQMTAKQGTNQSNVLQ